MSQTGVRLLLTAVLGPWVGRLIDRRGGRDVLAASNVVFAIGLAVLGTSEGFAIQCAAWVVRRNLPLGVAIRASFPDELGKIFRDVYPLLRFTSLPE